MEQPPEKFLWFLLKLAKKDQSSMNLELFAAFYENARKKGEYFSGVLKNLNFIEVFLSIYKNLIFL